MEMKSNMIFIIVKCAIGRKQRNFVLAKTIITSCRLREMLEKRFQEHLFLFFYQSHDSSVKYQFFLCCFVRLDGKDRTI